MLVAAALAQSVPEMPDPALPVERAHTAVLGGWAVSNIAVGTPLWATARTPQQRAFHGANAAWNTVNAGIAAVGWGSASKRRHQTFPAEHLQRRHRNLRRALAVNIGLDVLYIGTGIVLWTRGGEHAGMDLRGVGQSLVLQGGFLLAFDTTFLTNHARR